jgi:Ethylbenzene dehydrogenase
VTILKTNHPRCSVLAIALSVAACAPPRAIWPDGGTGGGTDAGTPIIFSIGVSDNANVSHQVATYVNLLLEEGSPSSDTVLSRRVLVPPTLDGLDSDWAAIAGSHIPLQPAGAVIGMTVSDWDTGYGLLADGGLRPWDFGVDEVLVKSAFDDGTIYFLVEWNDATASLAKNSLTFGPGGWTRSTDDEDHLYLSFNVSFPDFAELGCAAACHLREHLDDLTDAGVAFRTRMHTNGPGQVVDVWSWGSVSTNPIGYADDLSFQQSNRVSDDTRGFSVSNRHTVSDGGTEPIFMSEYGVNSNPLAIFAADAGLHPIAVPYDPTGLDAGAHVPGVVYQVAGGSRADVHAAGQWRNGKWTVELSRARVTSDPNDARF